MQIIHKAYRGLRQEILFNMHFGCSFKALEPAKARYNKHAQKNASVLKPTQELNLQELALGKLRLHDHDIDHCLVTSIPLNVIGEMHATLFSRTWGFILQNPQANRPPQLQEMSFIQPGEPTNKLESYKQGYEGLKGYFKNEAQRKNVDVNSLQMPSSYQFQKFIDEVWYRLMAIKRSEQYFNKLRPILIHHAERIFGTAYAKIDFDSVSPGMLAEYERACVADCVEHINKLYKVKIPLSWNSALFDYLR